MAEGRVRVRVRLRVRVRARVRVRVRMRMRLKHPLQAVATIKIVFEAFLRILGVWVCIQYELLYLRQAEAKNGPTMRLRPSRDSQNRFCGCRMTIKIAFAHFRGVGLHSIRTARPQTSGGEKCLKHALEAVA